MNELKNFDGGVPFVQPERPFMLVYEDKEGILSISWVKTEEELHAVVKEVRRYGCRIIDAIEINGCRDIEINC